MTIRSGWAYLVAAVLAGTVACSSDNNNGGTGGSGGHAGAGGLGGHHTGGNGGNAITGGGGNGGNATTGGGGNGGHATTGGGGNGGNATTGGGGNGGNHGGGGNGGNRGGGGAGGAVALTDAQIAGIALTANMGEVAQGQLAGSKSSNSDVLDFATMMITDHNAAITRLQQVLANQNIMTADSPERQMLFNTANTTYNTLFTQSGATFDKSYAMAQLTQHQTVLNLFDQMLLNGAQNAALKSELQMERTAVASHLAMAQALVSKLSSDGGAPHDAGGDAH